MKRIFLVVSALLLLGFSTLGFAEVKIAVVDVNKVLLAIPQIKNMQADLDKHFDQRKQEVINLQNTLHSYVENYKKNSVTMKKAMLKEEQQKLIDKSKKLYKMRVDLQRDFVAARRQALTPILKQIENVVNKIAQEQKIDLIVTKISIAYNAPQLEITDQVITEVSKLVATPVASITPAVSATPVTTSIQPIGNKINTAK